MSLSNGKAGAKTPVASGVLEAILTPYKSHCRYLQRAHVEVPSGPEAPLAVARGDFEIRRSWYIDDTGHFNSIEFNLCYNQLVYVLIGQCVLDKLVPAFSRMTFEEYRRRQLPDVLIAKFSSSFKRPMDSQSFWGTVAIESVSDRKKMLLLKTTCTFEGNDGGYSEGDVMLAIVNRESAPAQ